jgi:uncharacterized protein (TIGR02646 family)
MIRVRRGREPARLGVIRGTELPRVRALAAAGNPTSEQIGDRYTDVKQPLWQRQRHKCCYCEHVCQLNFHDLEHYRPKASANRGAGFPTHGYWWLAWTWPNLLFACPGCNRSGENDEFPLAAGNMALIPEEAPPRLETPLLLDPAAEDPIPHIQFRPVTKNGKRQWIPFPRNGSARGAATIQVLRLDRPDLLDLYENHANDHVLPAVTIVRNAIATGVKATVQSEWDHHVVPLVRPTRPYVALAYDIVDFEVPLGIRRQWGLRLARPR